MKIHALSTGTIEIKTNHVQGRGQSRAARAFNLFADANWSTRLPIYVWVIEHPEGIILIDTGDTAQMPTGWQHPFHTLATRKTIRPEEEIVPQLGKLGLKPSDVRWVVLTHLHIDHDGGVKHFPKAESIVAEGEYRQAAGFAGRLRGYVPQRWPKGWRPRRLEFSPEPLGPFERSFRLTKAGDVILLPTPGHTAHHLSVVVQADGLDYFFAGDTSYTEQLMLAGTVDGVSPDGHAARTTLARIRSFAEAQSTIYLPTHDPAAGARLRSRQVVPPYSAVKTTEPLRTGSFRTGYPALTSID